MTVPRLRWHVPVRPEEVPETGRHLDIVADPEIRASLAALAGLRELPRLEAAIDVARNGSGLRATGRVSATVGQTCVITLEPVQASVDEPFDVLFLPAGSAAASADAAEEAERLVDGAADLGALATEFLLLGIDPYPKAPGAVFAAPADPGAANGPFSVLARLKPKGEVS